MKLTVKLLKKILEQSLIMCNHDDLQKLMAENKALPKDQQYFPELTEYLESEAKIYQSSIPEFLTVEQKRELLMCVTDLTEEHLLFILNVMNYPYENEPVKDRADLFMKSSLDNRLGELWNLVMR